jgi:hypothetical protein
VFALRLLAATNAGAGAVIEKGVIRYVYIIVDFSWCMSQTDMKVRRCSTSCAGG